MSINNIEIQDDDGNIYHPQTNAAMVKYKDITIEEQIDANVETLSDIKKELTNYASYASLKDGNYYTVVDYKRLDGTMYLKSTMSNKDMNNYFQTCTLNYYDDLGTTVIKPIEIWTLTYDPDGNIISKEVAYEY